MSKLIVDSQVVQRHPVQPFHSSTLGGTVANDATVEVHSLSFCDALTTNQPSGHLKNACAREIPHEQVEGSAPHETDRRLIRSC